jgi:hypothetical protein
MKTGLIGFINNPKTKVFNEIRKLQLLLMSRYPNNFVMNEIIYTKIVGTGELYKMCRELRQIYEKLQPLLGQTCTFLETCLDDNILLSVYKLNNYNVTIEVGKFNKIEKINKFKLHDLRIDDIQVIELGHNGEIKIIKKTINDMISI